MKERKENCLLGLSSSTKYIKFIIHKSIKNRDQAQKVYRDTYNELEIIIIIKCRRRSVIYEYKGQFPEKIFFKRS